MATQAKVMGASVQRCRVHFVRNARACVCRRDRVIVTAAFRAALDQDTPTASKEHWAKLIEAFESGHPRLAELMRSAEEDVLAYKSLNRCGGCLHQRHLACHDGSTATRRRVSR